MKSLKILITCAAVGAIVPSARGATINQFLTGTPSTSGDWYISLLADSGTASIVSLLGQGGNLENSQPLPIGAARLTTINTNPSRAEVATFNFVSPGVSDFGPATALSTATLAYDFYKSVPPSTNLAVAPSLKVTIFAAGGTGDNFGALIWEPANQGSNPPQNQWTNNTIGGNTGGGGNDSVGGWWWNGGFNIGSSAGGSPFRSLSEWVTAFQAADPTDFANARIVQFSVGIGTFNPDQNNYFDNVQIFIPASGYAEVFDFEPLPAAAPVPEPTTFALLGLGVAGLAIRTRRRRPAN